MTILAQRAELFAAHRIPEAQSQSFRAETDPLAGPDFSSGIVIALRQMLDEVTFGTVQFLMRDGSEHTLRDYQAIIRGMVRIRHEMRHRFFIGPDCQNREQSGCIRYTKDLPGSP